MLKDVKTESGRRSIALPKLVIEALKGHQTEQDRVREAMGADAVRDNGLVCPCSTGGLWDPKNFAHDFRALVKKSGVPKITFHGLRHTHITHLLLANVHPKIASERAGRSGVAITMGIYSHVMPNNQQQAAETVDRIMQDAMLHHRAETGAGANWVPTRRLSRTAQQ